MMKTGTAESEGKESGEGHCTQGNGLFAIFPRLALAVLTWLNDGRSSTSSSGGGIGGNTRREANHHLTNKCIRYGYP